MTDVLSPAPVPDPAAHNLNIIAKLPAKNIKIAIILNHFSSSYSENNFLKYFGKRTEETICIRETNTGKPGQTSNKTPLRRSGVLFPLPRLPLTEPERCC